MDYVGGLHVVAGVLYKGMQKTQCHRRKCDNGTRHQSDPTAESDSQSKECEPPFKGRKARTRFFSPRASKRNTAPPTTGF